MILNLAGTKSTTSGYSSASHEAGVHGDQGAWKPVPLTGAVPSHRQSLALCGAPGRILGASSGHGEGPDGFQSIGFLNEQVRH